MSRFYRWKFPIHEGFIDEDLKIEVLTDHQIFQRYHQYKVRQGFTKDQALNVRVLRELSAGDFVTHIDHGIAKFAGLQTIEIGGQRQEAVRLNFKNNDIVYVSIHSAAQKYPNTSARKAKRLNWLN